MSTIHIFPTPERFQAQAPTQMEQVAVAQTLEEDARVGVITSNWAKPETVSSEQVEAAWQTCPPEVYIG
jgi:hypothetical protein